MPGSTLTVLQREEIALGLADGLSREHPDSAERRDGFSSL